MVLSGQELSSFLSCPLPLKSSPKRAVFPISRFNVKNGVSFGHVINSTSSGEGEKSPYTNLHHSKKINFDSMFALEIYLNFIK